MQYMVPEPVRATIKQPNAEGNARRIDGSHARKAALCVRTVVGHSDVGVSSPF